MDWNEQSYGRLQLLTQGEMAQASGLAVTLIVRRTISPFPG